MTLSDAYDLMDLLLDKADQPYFTTDEKNKFLDLAISDFINYHYQRLDVDEDSRRALSGCKDINNFEITPSDVYNLLYLDSTTNLASLSEKYDDYDDTNKGYFINTNEYVLPHQHLYLLQVDITAYDSSIFYDGEGAHYYSGKDLEWFEVHLSDKYTYSGQVPVKIVSLQEFYELENTEDPFKRPTKGFKGKQKAGMNPYKARWNEQEYYCTYLENRLIFSPSTEILGVSIKSITLPSVSSAFSAKDVSYLATYREVFSNHHQKQIVQIAVDKMTKTDVGLMTPPM
jgi:hypothetical protein